MRDEASEMLVNDLDGPRRLSSDGDFVLDIVRELGETASMRCGTRQCADQAALQVFHDRARATAAFCRC